MVITRSVKAKRVESDNLLCKAIKSWFVCSCEFRDEKPVENMRKDTVSKEHNVSLELGDGRWFCRGNKPNGEGWNPPFLGETDPFDDPAEHSFVFGIIYAI